MAKPGSSFIWFFNLSGSSTCITHRQNQCQTFDEIGNLIEEVVDLDREINVEGDRDDIQELLDSHYQALTIDELIEMHEQEQHIEELESFDTIQSEGQMTVGNSTDGLNLIEKGFVEWAQNEIAVAPDFHKRILFSDEAHFWLNGYVNKQNCRIWSEANPQVYVETPLHPKKLTVWCALWAGGILLQKR
ncbi:hypothetical protein TNCV_1132151 [Trichonephila clavipes]|nr:hypothetical protein TNCV_1132151 [Trichonephila clavipes]